MGVARRIVRPDVRGLYAGALRLLSGQLGRESGDIAQTLAIVWDSSRSWVLIGSALVLVSVVLPLVSLWVTKEIVNAIGGTMAADPAAIDLDRLLLLVGVFSAVAVVGAAVLTFGGLLQRVGADAVSDHVYDLIHRQSARLDLERYYDPGFHDMLHRAVREAPFRPGMIVNGLWTIVSNGMTLLGILLFLATIHWAVAPVLVLSALPGLYVRRRNARAAYRLHRAQTEAVRQAQYNHELLTGHAYAGELRAFGLAPLFTGRFREIRARLRREKSHLYRDRCVAELGADILAAVVVAGLLTVLVLEAAGQSISVGDLVAMVVGAVAARPLLGQFMRSMAALHEDALFVQDLYGFLALTPKIAEPPEASVSRQGAATDCTVEFHRVSFRYPGAATPALSDLTLRIEAGQHAAFVGENGSGKTTLVKLLCRLYDPTEGYITLGGVDLREWDVADLRRQIGVIFQNYACYQVSAGENIWLGDTALMPDSQVIEAAARDAGMADIIAGLPHGYATVLGNRFSESAELSLGQWQRMALARVLARHSPILVLDEPNSGLDAVAEAELGRTLEALKRHHTLITINQRLSLSRNADHIYLLEQGRLIEDGSHEELLRLGGRYRALFQTQAMGYGQAG